MSLRFMQVGPNRKHKYERGIKMDSKSSNGSSPLTPSVGIEEPHCSSSLLPNSMTGPKTNLADTRTQNHNHNITFPQASQSQLNSEMSTHRPFGEFRDRELEIIRRDHIGEMHPTALSFLRRRSDQDHDGHSMGFSNRDGDCDYNSDIFDDGCFGEQNMIPIPRNTCSHGYQNQTYAITSAGDGFSMMEARSVKPEENRTKNETHTSAFTSEEMDTEDAGTTDPDAVDSGAPEFAETHGDDGWNYGKRRATDCEEDSSYKKVRYQ